MTEKIDTTQNVIPETDECNTMTEITDTTPQTEKSDICVPVKYNKEIKNLSLEEAAVLAQKGMKYDAISEEYSMLRNLAAQESKSVPEFIADLKSSKNQERIKNLTEKCGGDCELAEHILELETGECSKENGFSELKEKFPEIKNIEDLPFEVVEKSKLKGTLLLDEYLRYLLGEKLDLQAAAMKQNASQKASIGSQINRKSPINPETEEFLKGLWK